MMIFVTETEQHDIEEINSEILIEDSVEPVIETEDIGEIEEIIEQHCLLTI